MSKVPEFLYQVYGQTMAKPRTENRPNTDHTQTKYGRITAHGIRHTAYGPMAQRHKDGTMEANEANDTDGTL